MLKKIVIPAIIFSVIMIVFLSLNSNPDNETSQDLTPDVYMPTKSSRPGCEEKDLCYIPSEISILAGDSVIWQNKDAAFHSVTSGSYENPDNLFDSGHLDPDETFTFSFETSGTYSYFCTLHPWMQGKVVVE